MVNVDGLNMDVGYVESTGGQRSVQRVAVGFAVEGDRAADDLGDVLIVVVFAYVSFLYLRSLVDALVAAGVVLSATVVSYAVSLSLLALSLVGNVVFALLNAAVVYAARDSLYSALFSLYASYTLYALYALYAARYSTLDSNVALLAVVDTLGGLLVLSVVLLSLNVLVSWNVLSWNELLSLSLVAVVVSLVRLVSLLALSLFSVVVLILHAVYALADLVVAVRVRVLSMLPGVDVSPMVPYGCKEEMTSFLGLTQ